VTSCDSWHVSSHFTLVCMHQAAGLVPNVEVCDILLHQTHMNFIYKIYIMQTMKTLRIQPNTSFIQKMEEDVAYAKKMIVKKVNVQDCLAAAI